MADLLIVEDEPHSARALKSFFEALDHRVRLAATAGDALSLAAEEPPDLVLTDLLLAGDDDGIHVARRLLAQDDPPVVLLMSGLPAEEIAQRAQGTDLFCTLAKPLRLGTVREAVEQALAERTT